MVPKNAYSQEAYVIREFCDRCGKESKPGGASNSIKRREGPWSIEIKAHHMIGGAVAGCICAECSKSINEALASAVDSLVTEISGE